MEPTSFRRSWIPGMWSWARSVWTFHARDKRSLIGAQRCSMEEVLNNSQPSGVQPGVHVEPELRRSNSEPKGVLRKNLKPLLYLGAAALVIVAAIFSTLDRKSTRLNSSHLGISYAVFCL